MFLLFLLLLPLPSPSLLLLFMYRFLTDKGIEYLREYLNLPADVVPATLTKSARPAGEMHRQTQHRRCVAAWLGCCGLGQCAAATPCKGVGGAVVVCWQYNQLAAVLWAAACEQHANSTVQQ
jgi:hypothetical protein